MTSRWQRFAVRHFSKFLTSASMICGAACVADDVVVVGMAWAGCFVIGLIAADVDRMVARLVEVRRG